MNSNKQEWRLGLGIAIIILWAWVVVMPAAESQDLKHNLWDQLLKQHIREGLVDYQAFMEDRVILEEYLGKLAEADAMQLSSQEARLAFWINAYNACVVKEVLVHYPLTSVKDISGFFKAVRCRAAGMDLSLNDIERKAKALGNRLLHFGLVCGSMGCPPLPSEAFVDKRVSAQLTDQAKRYLSDPLRGLRIDTSTSTVWISKIFDWHREDFNQQRRWLGVVNPPIDVQGLVNVLEPYLALEDIAKLRQGTWMAKTIAYDWSLNETAKKRR